LSIKTLADKGGVESVRNAGDCDPIRHLNFSDLEPMTTTKPVHSRIYRPLLGAGALCLALLLSACGGDDNNTPPPAPGGGDGGNGGPGTTPAACTTAHCAPAP